MFLLAASVCLAQGWNDYELDIGDGYHVFRTDSLRVGIDKDRHPLLSPDMYDNVGPLRRHLATPKHIFAMSVGRKPRNLFSGDKFQDIDPTKEFYFIITKGTEAVVGPLSKEDFAKRPEVVSLGQLDWKTPRNPSFWIPLLGTIFFIVLSIPMLAIKFFWIIIPIVVAILVLRNAKWRREEAAKAKTPLE